MHYFLARVMALAGIVLTSSVQAQVSDEPLGSSRYTLVEDCTEVASAIEQDFVLNRCEGLDGIPIWWRYSDSARLYVGFGVVPHSSGMFGIERGDDWPIEWRGSEYMLEFEPYAVIIRMREPFGIADGEPASFLTVFKLNRDGTSCIVGSQIDDNSRARRIADQAPFRDCEDRPRRYCGIRH